MFAAHAALPWPRESHLALWHGLNLLREHRGDGHISVVLAARLTPCQAAPLLMTMTGEDRTSRSARWPNEVWHQAVASLQKQGWLDDLERPTAESLAARLRVEDETDALALEPWQHLGAERSQRLWTLLRDLLRLLLDQDGVRFRTPLGLSWPAQWPG